jgi:hypothetical protein
MTVLNNLNTCPCRPRILKFLLTYCILFTPKKYPIYIAVCDLKIYSYSKVKDIYIMIFAYLEREG